MNKRGFFTIEAIYGTLLIVIIIVTIANVITINTARSKLSQKVEVLAFEASQNGGVYEADYVKFLQYLYGEGYDIGSLKFLVQRVDESDGSLTGNYLLSNESSSYIAMGDSNNQIHLTIEIPYKDNQIFAIPFEGFDEMVFERRTISRRNWFG